MRPSLLHAGVLSGLILSGNCSCCEFMSEASSSPHPAALWSSLTSGSYNLSIPCPTTASEPWGGVVKMPHLGMRTPQMFVLRTLTRRRSGVWWDLWIQLCRMKTFHIAKQLTSLDLSWLSGPCLGIMGPQTLWYDIGTRENWNKHISLQMLNNFFLLPHTSSKNTSLLLY